jgi:UDP-N-acetylmuramyl pentapeptide phosphotransferase/UDP-N-acetylglucosamine-1-phosphate transferase
MNVLAMHLITGFAMVAAAILLSAAILFAVAVVVVARRKRLERERTKRSHPSAEIHGHLADVGFGSHWFDQ